MDGHVEPGHRHTDRVEPNPEREGGEYRVRQWQRPTPPDRVCMMDDHPTWIAQVEWSNVQV
jgi:D-lyxose ketol-isomerase